MTPLPDFITRNKDWLFSGLGITIATIVFFLGKWTYQALRGRRPPDLRVKVQPAVTYHPALGSGSFVTITVQNHSSFPAFISSFQIELTGKQFFIDQQDGVTGEYQKKRELSAGDSLTFHISVRHLREYLAAPGHQLNDFLRAYVVDAVGRCYYSSKKECRASIAAAIS